MIGLIRIESRPDAALCRAAERAASGGWRRTIVVFGLIPIVVGLSLLLVGDEAWVPAVELIGLGAIDLTVLPWLAPWLRARSRARPDRYPHLIELSPDGVRTVGVGYDLTRPWAAVARVIDLPGQCLLMLGGHHYVAVPTSGLRPDQLTELRDLLRCAPAPVGAAA